MTQLDLFKEVATKYYDRLESGDSEFPLDFLPFDFESSAQEIIWGTFEEEFTRTMINDFNKFVSCLYKVFLLEKIIEEYDESEALNLRGEFIHVPLHYCLNRPYEFCGRIQYCCIVLCNQADILVFNTEDSTEECENYGFKEFKRASKKWSARDELLKALNAIANWDEDFVEATDDYRNKTQHRLPPNLDFGLYNSVNKVISSSNDLPEQVRTAFGMQPDQQFVGYAFGSKPPLKTADMLPVLFEQGMKMRELFYKYWDLVIEQSNAIETRSDDGSNEPET